MRGGEREEGEGKREKKRGVAERGSAKSVGDAGALTRKLGRR